MPHAVTYRRVLGTGVDIQELETVLGAFWEDCQTEDEQWAMAGKSLRSTIEAGARRGVHVLAGYAVGAGVVLNEVDVTVKENESSAAPKVLAALNLHGKVVSGDAMFTQRDLSAQLVERGGHYLWKVKDNQPTLRAAIERLFGPEHVPSGSAPLKTDCRSSSTVRTVGGRIERHTLMTSSLLNAPADWPALSQVCQLSRSVEYPSTGKPTHEVSYLIPAWPAQHASPTRRLALSRRHWAIENQLHSTRDVTCHEDRCRLALGHAAHAIALLNNLVLGLLRGRGFLSIPAARRRFNARPAEALALLLNAFV
jgi:predicted transposase YbfD/YdcC